MAKNYHDEMNDAFHKAERKVSGKNAGGYDHDMSTLKPKNARGGDGDGDNKFAERGESRRTQLAERKNKTSYGSKNVGADIGGGIEE